LSVNDEKHQTDLFISLADELGKEEIKNISKERKSG
jgi:hypothetical protein